MLKLTVFVESARRSGVDFAVLLPALDLNDGFFDDAGNDDEAEGDTGGERTVRGDRGSRLKDDVEGVEAVDDPEELKEDRDWQECENVETGRFAAVRGRRLFVSYKMTGYNFVWECFVLIQHRIRIVNNITDVINKCNN